MESRWARVERGWTVAAFSGLVAAVMHALAGGGFPPLGGIVVAVVLSGLAGMALIGRRSSWRRLAAASVASQVVFHVVFELAGTGASSRFVAHGHHHVVLDGTSAPAMSHSSPLMWVAHAAAALVTVVALRHGETVVWGAAGLLALALLAALRVPRPPRPLPRVRVRPRAVAPRPVERLAASVLLYRGPPNAPSHA